MSKITKISESAFSKYQSMVEILEGLVDDITRIRNALGGILIGSVAWNPADLADGAGESKDVSVPGAALGDFVLPSVELDIAGVSITAAVKSADTVTIRAQNESGSALNGVDFGTARILLFKKSAVALLAQVISKS